MSATPCWRRIKKLRDEGVIERQVALVDSAAVNLGLTVFVSVKTNQHVEGWIERFVGVVAQIPEIVEVYRMSGEVDYLLKVVVPDVAGYDSVYKRLTQAVPFSDVVSGFSMERIKHTTALPLIYA